MTQEQINELRKLAEDATPGPWIKRGYVLGIGFGVDGVTAVAHHTTSADADFISAANPAAILELIQQRDELLAALNSAASVSHSGGLCGYAEDDALRLVRVITLPYWDKSASDDKHREAIAKAEAQS